MKKIFLFLILFIFLFDLSQLEARNIRGIEFANKDSLVLKKEALFEKLVSDIKIIYPSNKSEGKPTLIGWSGYTGGGQTTTAKEAAVKLRDSGFKVTILGCDDYIIPKPERVTRKIISFPKPKGAIKIPGTRITITGIDEDTVGVKLPSLDESIKVNFEKKKIGDEVRVESTDIYLARQHGNKILVHIPEFISKLDPIFYRDIMDLKKGKSVLQPQFDQVTRKRIQLSPEELDELKQRHGKIQINEGEYVKVNEEKGTVADTKTGLVYKMIKPEGIIIVEGVWSMLRPEANQYFDRKIFVFASEETRLKRAGLRHILKGRYEGKMAEEIVREMGIDWWETQDEFAQRQEKIADYILNNDTFFSPFEMIQEFGPVEERIKKALSVYQNDIGKNEKKFNSKNALEYVWYVLSDNNPMEDFIEDIINHDYTEIGLKRKIASNQELDELRRGLLRDLLIKVGLLSEEKIKFSVPWSENKEFVTLFNNAVDNLSLPGHLLHTENDILHNWGFKEFTDFGRISTTKIEETAEDFATALYNFYTWKTCQKYLNIPNNLSILSLGSGDFMKEIFMYRFYNSSSMVGIELNEEAIFEAKENVEKWGLGENLGKEVELINQDMKNLDEIEQLEERQFNLIVVRIPHTESELKTTLEKAERFLKDDGYIIFHIRNPELSLARYKKIINLANELGISSFDTYPLSEVTSTAAKDKLVILKKNQSREFRREL